MDSLYKKGQSRHKYGGQATAEYILVLMLCVIMTWAGTNFFKKGLKGVYSGSEKYRAGKSLGLGP